MGDVYVVNKTDMTLVAEAIRQKGGTSDALSFPSGFVDAVGAIQAGSGGVTLPYEGAATPVGMQNLFYVISQGVTHSGEFTLANFLGKNEAFILDTGFSYVKGILILNVDWDIDNMPSANDSCVVGLAFYTDGLNETVRFGCHFNRMRSAGAVVDSMNSWIPRCSAMRWDSGKLYITPQFGGSAYPPFYAGHRHVWIAWGDE